jgi:gamma-F420-2:alpha-L-glutamate ligase
MDYKKGWIIYNGNIQSEKFLDYATWVQEAAKAKNIDLAIVKNTEVLPAIINGKSSIKSKWPLPAFVIFSDKDIRLATQFEKLGIRVYNSASSIEICDNKSVTYQKLADHGLPIPKTIIAPFIFSGMEIIDFSPYEEIYKELGPTLVIKEAYGSFGQQVYLINTFEQMIDKLKELNSSPMIFQEFITTSFGKDIRLNVVGNQVVAAMKRTSIHDFRANVSAGAKMEIYHPTKEEEELAIECSRIVGTDFAGVDLLFGEKGPVVCEVNSNAHIRNIYECTGINVAVYMIDYIVKDQLKKDDKSV